MASRLLLTIVALLIAAGCGGEAAPTAPPSASLNPPMGCLGLDAAGCTLVRDAVITELGDRGRGAVYIQIGPFSCRNETCPRGLAARPNGQVMVDFGAGDPAEFEVSAAGGSVTLAPSGATFHARLTPTSGRATQLAFPYQLGHCGLFSPIDVDGSFWDPVGLIDDEHPDVVNSAPAIFTITSPRTATLRTAGGFSLDLVRHDGPKHVPLCA